MTVAFLFDCLGVGVVGLSFWGWASCFGESSRIRERRMLLCAAAQRSPTGRASAALHPARVLDP